MCDSCCACTYLASTQTVTHEYLTQSGKVMRETVRTDGTVTSVLDFIYDESGKPFAMVDQLSAQPKTYYYVLNLQGDVVKLVDVSGAEVASYEYDAWGNVLSQSGSMASTNPLRYRGYYFDSETGFYYLQSRYYDPATRRFINADSYGSTGQGFVGTNMFAYCNNSPILMHDEGGNIPNTSLMVTDSSHMSNDSKQRIYAKAKYNSTTVNCYLLPEGADDGSLNVERKVNISFYYVQDYEDCNIRIWNSTNYTNPYEMEAIIEVMMNSDLYDASIFTHTKQQYFNEWWAHNYAYELASKGHVSPLDRFIIRKAEHVDFGANDSSLFWEIF